MALAANIYRHSLGDVGQKLLGWASSAHVRITTGRNAWWADATLAQVEAEGAGAGPQLAATGGDKVAAILFTSGSTGVPKGVVYRHRHFIAQIEMLGRAFGIEAGGIDLPTFPPFALFDPALGLTSIIPDMDPTRPAKANPRKLHKAITRFGVTQLFGSPALMRVLAEEYGESLPSIRRVTSAGAPGRCRRRWCSACWSCCRRMPNSGHPTVPPNACRSR